jgi:hypothetical protein
MSFSLPSEDQNIEQIVAILTLYHDEIESDGEYVFDKDGNKVTF